MQYNKPYNFGCDTHTPRFFSVFQLYNVQYFIWVKKLQFALITHVGIIQQETETSHIG